MLEKWQGVKSKNILQEINKPLKSVQPCLMSQSWKNLQWYDHTICIPLIQSNT